MPCLVAAFLTSANEDGCVGDRQTLPVLGRHCKSTSMWLLKAASPADCSLRLSPPVSVTQGYCHSLLLREHCGSLIEVDKLDLNTLANGQQVLYKIPVHADTSDIEHSPCMWHIEDVQYNADLSVSLLYCIN